MRRHNIRPIRYRQNREGYGALILGPRVRREGVTQRRKRKIKYIQWIVQRGGEWIVQRGGLSITGYTPSPEAPLLTRDWGKLGRNVGRIRRAQNGV